jgi:hypothetical protein
VTSDPVRAIADAVLYEGYLLWPYRRSALKNQQRFTFGGVYPPAWDDRSALQAQVLLEGGGDIDVSVRCLHVVRRQVERDGEPLDELRHGRRRWQTWDEAVERELRPGAIAVAAGEHVERIPGGTVRRWWRALRGAVLVGREPVAPGLERVTVRAENTSPWSGVDREDALRETLCSAHAVLRAERGSWISATDAPAHLVAHARACAQDGWWPVLAGGPGDRSTVLASPIILPDHPAVAPESPGDLFDSAEIDAMLVLNILAMTEEERRDMRDADPRARAILERTEGLGREEIMRLHGVVRESGPVRR